MFGVGFDLFSTLFPIFFTIIFVFVIGTMIAMLVRGANDMDYCTTDTTYYVTFQVESGDRMELRMTGRDYGMLFEGDRGTLHFQGTRYLGFDRS